MSLSTSKVSVRMRLAEVLERLADETERLTRDGDWLQSRLASLALMSSEPTLAEDLQVINSMAQQLMALTDILNELGAKVPADLSIDVTGRLPQAPPAGFGGVRSAQPHKTGYLP